MKVTHPINGHQLSHRDRVLTAEVPPPVSIDVERIPEELINRARWVTWRWNWNGKRWTKVPSHHVRGYDVDCNSPDHWLTFNTAIKAAERKGFGVGIAFNGDGLIALDLDKCRDPDTGMLTPWAETIVNELNSYTEVSPTGTGLRVIFFGSLPELPTKKFKQGEGDIEFFNSVKFCTVTGQHLSGTPDSVQERQEALTGICSRLSAARVDITRQTLKTAETKDSPTVQSDDRITTLREQSARKQSRSRCRRCIARGIRLETTPGM